MKNIAIINAINLTPYAYKIINSGKSAFASACEAAWKFPHIEKVIVLTDKRDAIPETGQRLQIEQKDSWDVASLLQALESVSGGMDSIFYYFGDCPFIDPLLAEKMSMNHTQYFADYSFADGYPYGLAPEIISPRILKQLLTLSEKSSSHVKRESIFDIIKKDINSFDVETELSPSDLRFLRVSLCADKKRNFLLLERILSLGNTDSASILATIANHQEILRTLPSFFSIQIVERCPYACSYCPYPRINDKATSSTREMQIEQFSAILDKIEGFSEDAYIDISLWGDPALHSDIIGIIRNCSGRHAFEVIIETSGIGWKEDELASLSASARKSITWIVSLDASKREVYEQLRGKGFDEAQATTDRLMKMFPGKVYVQAVRMKENEEDVELFFNQWKTKNENMIIQKYDHFCGFLPEKKVTDLSPVKRMPCWHVKRDMSILLDGTVPLCKEDLQCSLVLGNIFREEIHTIWEKGNAAYLDHVGQKYIDICSKCDEYYTYNF